MPADCRNCALAPATSVAADLTCSYRITICMPYRWFFPSHAKPQHQVLLAHDPHLKNALAYCPACILQPYHHTKCLQITPSTFLHPQGTPAPEERAAVPTKRQAAHQPIGISGVTRGVTKHRCQPWPAVEQGALQVWRQLAFNLKQAYTTVYEK